MNHDLKVLDLSTVHFSPIRDEEHLKDVCTMSGASGYLVYPGGEYESNLFRIDEVTDGLLDILEYAREESYDYILFDRDGLKHKELPTFEEDWRKAHASASTPPNEEL